MTKGELGTASFNLRLLIKGGESCPVCGSTIEQLPVQNRGTCFCPRCQPFGSGPLIEKLAAESSPARITAKGVIDNQINRHIISKTVFNPFSVVIRDQ